MTRRQLRSVFVLAASSALSACNLFFSLDDYAAPPLASCSTCAAARCQCAPNAPAGFDHARLLVGAKTADLCPAGTVAGVAMGQGVVDAGCACDCEPPATPPACALTLFSGDACAGAPVQSITSSTCTALSKTGPLSAAVRPVASGACTVSAKPEPADFKVRVLACLDQQPGTSGCDERTTCTAALDSPFDDSPCIVAKAGANVSCPDAYSHKYTFTTDFDDQRACDDSSCACGPQACPDTTVTLCPSSTCSGTCGLSAESFSNCKKFNGLTHGRVDSDGKAQGQCPPSGTSTSTGTLSPSGSLVVCCRGTLPKGA